MFPSSLRLAGPAGLAAAVAALAPAAVPSPAVAATATAVSSNWAGYAVTGKRYRRVTGSWTVTKGDCDGESDGYSATWIGLGGFDQGSQALEQTGTELDCSASGRASYSAWYELVPAASRTIRMKVRAGDRMAAAVSVSGTRVTMTLRNRTTGKSYRKVARMSAPDVSSAEWIVEAPTGCDADGRCSQLPLNDFGTVRFTGASATTTAGHTGSISDTGWSATAVELSQEADRTVDGSVAAALPSALAAGGSAFSVSYRDGTVSSARARRTLPSRVR